MTDEYRHPPEAVTAAQIKLSAQTLQKLSKIDENDATMDDIILSLEETMEESFSMSPKRLCDLISVQARVLDAAFNKEMNLALSSPDRLDRALRLQQQTLRTLMTWKTLRSDIYIKTKTIQLQRFENKRAERTEQKDDMWIPGHAPVDR